MSNTRFTLLEIGVEFVFDGVTYRKSTPLLAVDVSSNKQRMIPRSAMVQLNESQNSTVNEPESHKISATSELQPEAVVNCIDELITHCDQLLTQVTMPVTEKQIHKGKKALQQKRSEILQQLGISIIS